MALADGMCREVKLLTFRRGLRPAAASLSVPRLRRGLRRSPPPPSAGMPWGEGIAEWCSRGCGGLAHGGHELDAEKP